jgi:glycosyltransferase involved in cell wall biosynthesis
VKILHALGWYYPESLGGTEVYVSELARRQVAAGHHVVIVAPRVASLGNVMRYEHDGIPVVRYQIPDTMSRDEAQSFTRVRGSQAFDEILREENATVVHFHTFTAGLGHFEVAAAREAGAHVVATNHLGSLGYICQRGSLMVWGTEPCDGILRVRRCSACTLQARGVARPAAWGLAVAGEMIGAPQQASGRWATALGIPHLIQSNKRRQENILDLLDRYVFLSQRAINIVVANGADREKLALNYLGTSHAEIDRKPGPDERPTEKPIRLGYVGRLDEIKGVVDLARAFRSLPSSLPVHLEYCGPNETGDARHLADEIRSVIGDDARVSMTGALTHAEIPERLRSYDVLCVPSVTFEGGPTVIHEARAAGTPVIGTSIGAIPELVRNGIDGALVRPGDWRALAALIESIVANPAETVDHWRRNLLPPRSMDDVAADYELLYDGVMAT